MASIDERLEKLKKQKEELIRKPENIEKFLSDKINCDEFIHMKSKV